MSEMAGISEEPTARQITSLPLPRFLKLALTEAGYKTTTDVAQVSASDLSTELGIGLVQAEDVIRYCEPSIAATSQSHGPGPSRQSPQAAPLGIIHSVPSATAAELLTEASRIRISTLSKSIDSLIARFTSAPPLANGDGSFGKGKGRASGVGAIVPGMTVEISGPPGIGKTSLAMGMVMSARMCGCSNPGENSSVAGAEVLVIDAEGAFIPGRFTKAATVLNRNSSTSSRSLLGGVHLVRIATQVQMVAFLNRLDEWLEEHSKVNLIIIDSLSFHFRQPTLDINTRRRIMELVKLNIAKATTMHHCAVVVINQLATKLFTAENEHGNFNNGDKAILMPQLGELWTTAKTIRLVLFRGPPGNELRYAHASTSSDGSLGTKWACFDIDSYGLPIDLPEQEPS